ncbi:NHL repeat-containing protein [candidate division KSB1 bacterium]
MMRSQFAGLLLISILIFSCSGESTYTIEELDGVRYVHNLAPLWGDEERISLEFIRKIGELEGENENYMLYNPRDVAVDGLGNIFILDAGAYRIMKYDSEGKYITTIGRRGQGPGELDNAWGLDIDSNNMLYISGNYSKILNVFDNNGKFIKRIRGEFRASFINKMNNGNFVSYFSVMDPKNYETAPLIQIFNADGEVIKEFEKRRIYEEMNMKWQGNTISIITDSKDNIYTSYYYQNKIVKYDSDGKKLMVVSRELPYPESETFEMKSYQKDGEVKHYRKVNHVSMGIGIDNKERIWVPRQKRELTEEELKNDGRTPDNNLLFEVYDPDGILLGHAECELPQRVYATRVFNDRIFLIDCYEEMAVFEYRIVEK